MSGRGNGGDDVDLADGSDPADGSEPDGPAPVDDDPDLAPEASSRSPRVVTAGHINWDVTIHVDLLP